MLLLRNLLRRRSRSEALLRRLLGRGLASSVPSLPLFDHQPRAYKGMLAEEVLQKRKKFLGPSLFYYYQKPVISLLRYFLEVHLRSHVVPLGSNVIVLDFGYGVGARLMHLKLFGFNLVFKRLAYNFQEPVIPVHSINSSFRV